MSMSREIAHRLLDELWEMRSHRQSEQVAEARRHFLLAKRELLLGALALVDNALESRQRPIEGAPANGSQSIPVEG